MHVENRNGQFYIVDAAGNTVEGPFGSELTASFRLDKLTGGTGADDLSKRFPVVQGNDKKYYIINGSTGQVIGQPYETEGQASSARNTGKIQGDTLIPGTLPGQAVAATSALADAFPVVQGTDGNWYIQNTTGGVVGGPYANSSQATLARDTGTNQGNRFVPGSLSPQLTAPTGGITPPFSAESGDYTYAGGEFFAGQGYYAGTGEQAIAASKPGKDLAGNQTPAAISPQQAINTLIREGLDPQTALNRMIQAGAVGADSTLVGLARLGTPANVPAAAPGGPPPTVAQTMAGLAAGTTTGILPGGTTGAQPAAPGTPTASGTQLIAATAQMFPGKNYPFGATETGQPGFLTAAEKAQVDAMASGAATTQQPAPAGPQAATGATTATTSKYTFPAAVEAQRAKVAQYFPASEVDKILYLIDRESGGDPTIRSKFPDPTSPDGQERSFGLLQINLSPQAHFDKVPGKTFEEKAAWLKNPDNNLSFAAQLYADQGYIPWATGPGMANSFPAELSGTGTAASTAVALPGTGVITQQFGPGIDQDGPGKWLNPATGKVEELPHLNKGLDIDGETGDPISAFYPGTVVNAGPNGTWGNNVQVKDAQGNIHNYSHLSAVNVKVGDTVTPGQVIGAMGNTGVSTGSHLSYDVMRSDGVWIDPTQFTSGTAGGLTPGAGTGLTPAPGTTAQQLTALEQLDLDFRSGKLGTGAAAEAEYNRRKAALAATAADQQKQQAQAAILGLAQQYGAQLGGEDNVFFTGDQQGFFYAPDQNNTSGVPQLRRITVQYNPATGRAEIIGTGPISGAASAMAFNRGLKQGGQYQVSPEEAAIASALGGPKGSVYLRDTLGLNRLPSTAERNAFTGVSEAGPGAPTPFSVSQLQQMVGINPETGQPQRVTPGDINAIVNQMRTERGFVDPQNIIGIGGVSRPEVLARAQATAARAYPDNPVRQQQYIETFMAGLNISRAQSALEKPDLNQFGQEIGPQGTYRVWNPELNGGEGGWEEKKTEGTPLYLNDPNYVSPAATPLNSSLAAFALQLLRQNRGYKGGGEFTVNEPAIVMGLQSGRPIAVVGEGMNKQGGSIPETLDATRNKAGVYEVDVEPHAKPTSLALSIPGVPGYAYDPSLTDFERQQQAQQRAQVDAAIKAAKEQAALEEAVSKALGISPSGSSGGSSSTSTYSPQQAAVDRARRKALAVQRQILEASQDPVDMLNVARIRQQRAANTYKRDLAGLPEAQALTLPNREGLGQLPPGMFLQPLTLAEWLTAFRLPELELKVQEVATSPRWADGDIYGDFLRSRDEDDERERERQREAFGRPLNSGRYGDRVVPPSGIGVR